MLFQLSPTPLEDMNLREGMLCAEAGAFVTFEGLVRSHNEGKNVTALEYEAFAALCEKEGQRVLQEALDQFDILGVKCVHRVGKLIISEMAVWVGVTAAHRDHAFKACRYIIDEVKSRLPIWKKEYYVNGDSGWVSCEACGHAHLSVDINRLSSEDISEYNFVDIRETSECALDFAKEIPNIFLPLSQFKKEGFAFDKNKKYILFCAQGGRSLRMAKELHQQGMRNIFSLDEGLPAIHKYFKNHEVNQ